MFRLMNLFFEQLRIDANWTSGTKIISRLK